MLLFYYGNDLTFKQTYTSFMACEKLMIFGMLSIKVKIKVYLERATVKTYIQILLWLKSDKQ